MPPLFERGGQVITGHLGGFATPGFRAVSGPIRTRIERLL